MWDLLAGGAAVAYAAGPGLVIVGLMETVSLSAAGLAGASGGFLTHWLFSSAAERRLEENYEQVLIFMTDTLLQKLQQKHVEVTFWFCSVIGFKALHRLISRHLRKKTTSHD